MQIVGKNRWKGWSKNNGKCSQEWMKTEYQCKLYSKNDEKCSPKIMQKVVQNEWNLYSNAKCEDNAKCSQKWMKTVIRK